MATLSYYSVTHFFRNRQRRFRKKWERVAGGGLVAANCISGPGQARRKILLISHDFRKR